MNGVPRQKLVLMAEDDPDDRLLAKDAFKDSGLDVEIVFAEDGVDLMDYLHHRNKYKLPAKSPLPGLIILDLNMPRKDGREALAEIKADAELKKIPVVVLTTSTADTDIARVYELGANSFISKPTAYKDLVELVKTIGDYWFKAVILSERH